MDEKIRARVPEESGGFTLVELIITLAVLGILSAIAYPSLTQSIANNQVRSQAEEIQSILAFAPLRSNHSWYGCRNFTR